MTKGEAAKILGVSVRSLERMVAQGELIQGVMLRNGRRTANFDEAEVTRLASKITVPTGGFDASESHEGTVSFRLDAQQMFQLKERAQELGVSHGTLSRIFVVTSLEKRTDEDRFAFELKRMRESLAETFFNFLVMKCDTPKDKAKQFVRENFLRD